MTLINSSASHESSNNMYYVKNEGILNSGKTSIEHMENLLQQLKLGITDTSRNEQFVFQGAMETVKNNIFITINEYEKCTTIDEVILNGLRILYRNERYKDITMPLIRAYDTSLADTSVPDMDKAYNMLVGSLNIQYKIEEIFAKLLPLIAKRNKKDMNEYSDMEVRDIGSGKIKMDTILRNIKSNIENQRMQQELFQARFIYLDNLTAAQKILLIERINAKTSQKISDIIIRCGVSNDKTLTMQLVHEDKKNQTSHIINIDSTETELTYLSFGGKTEQSYIMDIVMDEAIKNTLNSN